MLRRALSFVALAFVSLASVLSSSCLRFSETPDEWPCDRDDECSDGTHCIGGRCQPLSACRTDSDCSQGYACSARRCTKVVPPECSQASPQSCEPYGCDPSLHCYKSCTGPEHCASGYKCASSVCIEAECTLANAASACGGYACIGSACARSCSTDSHCASGYTCIDASCRSLVALGEECEFEEECANGTCCGTADGGRGVCVVHCRTVAPGASCEYDEECLSGDCSSSRCTECADECVEDLCRGIECGYVAGSVDCGQCSERAYCAGNVCIEACLGMECGIDNGVDCGACAEDETCSNSLCVPDTCFEGTYVCDGDRVLMCTPGLPPQEVAYCDGNEYCRDGRTGCLTYACEPGQGFCEDGTYVPCNGAGRPVVYDERHCEAEGRKCTEAGCALVLTEIVETLDPDIVDGQTACGNVYFVERDVTLTLVTQVMGSSTANEIHWFVYEAASAEGPFTPVITPLMGDGYYDLGQVNSPPLTIELESGSHYLIGLAAEASSYIIQADAPMPQELSFGSMLFGVCSSSGAAETLTSTDLEQVGVVAQRVTTRTLD